jgi:hypothetical protein
MSKRGAISRNVKGVPVIFSVF